MSDTATLDALPTWPLPDDHPLAQRAATLEAARQQSPTFAEAEGHVFKGDRRVSRSAIRRRYYAGEFPHAWNDDGTTRVPFFDIDAIDGWEYRVSLSADDEDAAPSTQIVPPADRPSTPAVDVQWSGAGSAWVRRDEYERVQRELAEAKELAARIAAARDVAEAKAAEREAALERADRSMRVLELTAGSGRPRRLWPWQRQEQRPGQ